MEEKIDIRELSKDELISQILALGEKKFRAKQIWQWLWEKGVTDFDEMTNLSKEFRALLKEYFVMKISTEDVRQVSNDGTIKSRFSLFDNKKIETVLIPKTSKNRYTVCVSSQVGCSLNCTFCATGKMGLLRNLTASEIYDQVVSSITLAGEIYDHSLTNIVYMGMGEPLLNYNNIKRSIEMITSEEGLGMSPRRITISTAGIAKMIKKIADDGLKVNFALSLHAATDEKRNKIMPINETNNLDALVDALDYYYQKIKGKITFEYLLLKDFNDSLEDARNLVKLGKRIPAKINIIEYNPVEGVEYTKADDDKLRIFEEHLVKAGIPASVRRSRGKDIDAACGQLANK